MTRRRLHAVDIRDDAASDEQQDALGLGHAPICDLDAEGSYLSALLCGNKRARDVLAAGVLAPSHFYSLDNQRVFTAALAAHAADKPPVMPVVASILRDSGELAKMDGGSKYLALLVDCTPATAYPEVAAGDVVEKWRLRRLVEVMSHVAVRVRHGELSHEAARRELKAHFEGVRR